MALQEQLEELRIKKNLAQLIGRRIEAIRITSAREMRLMVWDQPGAILTLDDGTELLLMADPEGNGPGHLEIWASPSEGDCGPGRPEGGR